VSKSSSFVSVVIAAGFLAHGASAVAQSDIGRDKIACEQGDVKACLRNGARFRDGDGVTKDIAVAIDFFTRGCSLGEANACFHAATCIEKDRERSREAQALYEKTCFMGEARGCLPAEGMLETEKDQPGDRARAVKILEHGCTLRNAEACDKLALVLDVAGDFVEAHRYFEAACSMQSAEGCLGAGMGYLYGSGVAQDWDKFVSRTRAACILGNRAACRFLVEQFLDFLAFMMLIPVLVAAVVFLSTWSRKRRRTRRPLLWSTLGIAACVIVGVYLNFLGVMERKMISVLVTVYWVPLYIAIWIWAWKKTKEDKRRAEEVSNEEPASEPPEPSAPGA
jgi:hypothetical protein